MKALTALLGIATAATLLYVKTRARKPKTKMEKAMILGGRLAALGTIGYCAVKSEIESMSDTLKDARKQSIKAWNSEPKLSIRVR